MSNPALFMEPWGLALDSVSLGRSGKPAKESVTMG
ncbi:hypothetical protein QFZ78_006692 [Paenibacillus sp. V4I5]|nr:hypothetical protein [Paenibacillus sp. V4I5]